jgi:pimeloyl-ACP methyl ester carboxylesterase
MKTWLPSMLGLGGLIYGGLCAWVYLAQRAMIYFPVPERRAAPPAEPIRLPVDGAVLKIWRVANAEGPALIYFGGNAEDVGASVGEFSAVLPRYSLYFVNYRGYGGSTGRPSERSLVADALELFDTLHASHARIAVVGRSLGSAVAVQLAAARPVAGLVLVTPFDSAVQIGRAVLPWLPISLLLRDRYDSVARAPSIKAPTLVLIAAQDEVIARQHSEALVAALPPAATETLTVRGAGHNDIQLWPPYYRRIGDFLQSRSR